jgi:hypothetical protein
VNVLVYRPDESAIDRNGDPIDSDGNVIRPTSPGTYVGILARVVLADPEVQSLSRGVDTDTASGNAQARGAVASVDALIGAPVDAPITLQHSDIVLTDQGVSYALFGPRTYGRPNVITGQPVRINGSSYYWLRATALVN